MIQKFLFTVGYSFIIGILSVNLLGCGTRASGRLTFDHQAQLARTPEKIFLPLSQEQKVFNDLVTLFSRILNVRYNIEPDPTGYDVTFKLNEQAGVVRVRKRLENLEVSTSVAGKPDLAKAINYYLMTGIFERGELNQS